MSTGPIVRVQTPSFGVCSSEMTAGRCVLSDVSCGDSEIYTAPYESENIPGKYSCKNPKEVEVGRCTSSLDNVRCVPSEVSCGEKSPFYNKIDPTCSLVTDKIAEASNADETEQENSDSPFDTPNDNPSDDDNNNDSTPERTTFPACAILDDGIWQCVLDETSCRNNERVVYAKWASDFGPHPCHCEDVPTGICYETDAAEGKLTPNNSFCAVSVRDCPATHLFMNDREFLASEQATYDCRFCDETTVGSEGVPNYPAGACLESGASQTDFSASSFESCALESSECSSGSYAFVSASRLEQQGLFCPMERTTNWGICSNQFDPVVCTNKPSSCLYSYTFLKKAERECDINRNSNTGVPTYFSSCSPKSAVNRLDMNDVRCVWDEWECDPNEERWQEARLPNDAWFTGCTCENVFTGVCQEPSTGEYHCAVSPEGCSTPNTYVSQRLLKDKGIDMECQLCPPQSSSPLPQLELPSSPPAVAKLPPTLPPVQPTPPPIETLVPLPTDQPVMPVLPPTFKPTDQARPTLPPAVNVGGPVPTVAPIPVPTFEILNPTVAPIPLPTFSPIVNGGGPEPTVAPIPWPTIPLPTNAPELRFESETLPTSAVIFIAVGPVVVIAFIVVIYTMFTGGGILKSNGDPDAIEPNHNQEMVLPTATLT